MNHARQNTTSHYWSEGSLQDNRPIREFHLSVLPPRRRAKTTSHQVRKTDPHNHQRDTRLDRKMCCKGILVNLRPYAALLICAAAIVLTFFYTIGQTSQFAYQEGLRAGKASAQAVAYDQGYAKGYASAMYEVA